MNQVKNDIIDKIIMLEDEAVINALKRILDNLNAPASKNLSNAEKELVLMGMKDYKNGKTVSDDTLRKEEDAWLNE